MSLLDIFRMNRLKKYDGSHETSISLLVNGSREDLLVRFTYHPYSDTYDIDFVGKAGASEDLWYKLSSNAQDRVLYRVNNITGEWRTLEGIKSKRKGVSPIIPFFNDH